MGTFFFFLSSLLVQPKNSIYTALRGWVGSGGGSWTGETFRVFETKANPWKLRCQYRAPD